MLYGVDLSGRFPCHSKSGKATLWRAGCGAICGEQLHVFTVVQVVVVNSCVDRLTFVVGEWRDRGTTEDIVLVVFCLLFFFGTNLASHVTSGSPSLWF